MSNCQVGISLAPISCMYSIFSILTEENLIKDVTFWSKQCSIARYSRQRFIHFVEPLHFIERSHHNTLPNKFSTRRYCSITFISLFISYFQVKIDVSESSREFRQATFVMYNCARLAKLFENFEKNVLKGENKQNSHIWKTHVKQLRVSIIL